RPPQLPERTSPTGKEGTGKRARRRTGHADLATLAARINAEHEAGQAATRKGLEHYRVAGGALIQAKAEVLSQNGGKRGRWRPWVKTNCQGIGRVQAWRYMEFAERFVTKPSMRPEEQWAEWRVICGNAPPEGGGKNRNRPEARGGGEPQSQESGQAE